MMYLKLSVRNARRSFSDYLLYVAALTILLAVMVFVVFHVVGGTKNDVVVDVTFINVGGDNIRVFPL